ncbi:uncharacterized protein LOC131849909 [Achroia grisella]|uniref:uncharacterized protein LOC131849909 n=1 Tax=Achroia grisella TaxID=688607 RepID=UPI0027D228EC|nr:uncharacterized protein LOC131849909 [Achroia grisella]
MSFKTGCLLLTIAVGCYSNDLPTDSDNEPNSIGWQNQNWNNNPYQNWYGSPNQFDQSDGSGGYGNYGNHPFWIGPKPPPGYGYGQGSVSNPGNGQGSFGQGPSSSGPWQSGYEQGQSGFKPGQNGFGQGQNSFGQGQNSFGQGQGGFGQGQTNFGQEPNSYGSFGVFGQNQPFGFGYNPNHYADQGKPGQISFGHGQNGFGIGHGNPIGPDHLQNGHETVGNKPNFWRNSDESVNKDVVEQFNDALGQEIFNGLPTDGIRKGSTSSWQQGSWNNNPYPIWYMSPYQLGQLYGPTYFGQNQPFGYRPNSNYGYGQVGYGNPGNGHNFGYWPNGFGQGQSGNGNGQIGFGPNPGLPPIQNKPNAFDKIDDSATKEVESHIDGVFGEE